MNKKEIVRDQKIVIKVSKEEKQLWEDYAKYLEIPPTRLARNVLMIEAEKNAFEKGIIKASLMAYKKYAEVTNNKEVLERLNQNKDEINI